MGWASAVPSHRVAYYGRAHRSAEQRRLARTLSLLLVIPVAAEAVQQFGALALAQTAERLRVSDAAIGKDPAGFDRADLRERQEDVAHSRRPHALGRPGEDLRRFDLSRGEIPTSASLSPTGSRWPAAMHADAVPAIRSAHSHLPC